MTTKWRREEIAMKNFLDYNVTQVCLHNIRRRDAFLYRFYS